VSEERSDGHLEQVVEVRRLLEASDLRNTHWSIEVRDAASRTSLVEVNSHALLRTASVAKVYLLIEIAARLVAGDMDPLLPVDRRSTATVADSGLWQHFASDVLPVVDAARLVGSVSDNLATNALIDLVGLDVVQARASKHAADGSTLHDVVRDVRGPEDPPTLSEGSAADWASLFVGLKHGAVESPRVSDLVLAWLASGADLSMVASAFGLDPLSHAGAPDRRIAVWNKTGTDIGVRADVGAIDHEGRTVAYAVICNWSPLADPHPRDAVLSVMRRIGEALRRST
jgi:beta-lactamase class A